MKDLIKKVRKDFVEIDPELSINKAFEKLAEPNVEILIYVDSNLKEFYYLTGHDIHKKIRNQATPNNLLAKDAAIKSLIFNLDEYSKTGTNYVLEFKNIFSKFGIEFPYLILVLQDEKPLGLISDLEIINLEVKNEIKFISDLDNFITSEPDPIKSIDRFYNHLESLGFNLTSEIRHYIFHLINHRVSKEELKTDKAQSPENLERIELAKSAEAIPTKTKINTQIVKQMEGNGIVIVYNPTHINHYPKVSSPETPERITKIIQLLKNREKVFNEYCRLISDFKPVEEEDLLKVHTRNYVQFVKDYAAKGGGFLGDSTYITKTTHDIALLAAGGAIRASEEVIQGKSDFAFALIRPPGHHAGADKYGGYCIYNNAAVLARYLQNKKGFKKILILDWDAHAANGTMEIFYDDPSVMLISIHQDPHNYYPKTGFLYQMGKSKGLGYTINVEMPRGSGNEEYLTVLNELVIPLYENFQPDFIIGCNGFDAHHSDQYTDLNLTSEGYYEYCRYFRKNFKRKMVILMEGGYNPYMGELTHTIINGLLGLQNPFEEKYHSLATKLISREKTYLILNNKLKELKYNLKGYNIL